MTTPNPGRLLLTSGTRTALVTSLWWGVASSVAAGAVASPQGPSSARQAAAVAVETAATGTAATQGLTDRASHITRVRAATPKAAAVLKAGVARSATVARLIETLEQSDLYVYVETTFLHVPGQLRFAIATPQARFLRITLNVPEAEDRLIAWLAHELQHAIEVAQAPEVTSPGTLAQFYSVHGERVSAEGQCTRAAQRITTLVLAEVGAAEYTRK